MRSWRGPGLRELCAEGVQFAVVSPRVGCWTLANPTTPLPDVILRFLDPAQRDALEESWSEDGTTCSTRCTEAPAVPARRWEETYA